MQLQIPQVRDLEDDSDSFYPTALERGLRSERALKLAVAEMYIKGVSTRKVQAITEKLCGLKVTSMQVSRAAEELDGELEAWRSRSLGKCPYLVLDARYEKVRHGGTVVDCSVLIATTVPSDGKRSVLGCSVSLSEAEVHWRDFLKSLQDRGLHGVKLITSDDHKGLKKAIRARFGSVPRLEMKSQVAADIRQILHAPDRRTADELLARTAKAYEKKAPSLAQWMVENIPQGLTVLELPEAHRKRMRTTNGLERLNQEIKRRTRVATLFPNEKSLLRLVTAILAEVSDEWETGKTYLNMKGI